jgi:hypothetical protein
MFAGNEQWDLHVQMQGKYAWDRICTHLKHRDRSASRGILKTDTMGLDSGLQGYVVIPSVGCDP